MLKIKFLFENGCLGNTFIVNNLHSDYGWERILETCFLLGILFSLTLLRIFFISLKVIRTLNNCSSERNRIVPSRKSFYF